MILFFQRSNEKQLLNLSLNGYKNISIKNTKLDVSPNYEEIYILPEQEFSGHVNYIMENHSEIEIFRLDESVITEQERFPCMIGKIKDSSLFRSDLDTLEVMGILHKEKKEKIAVTIYSENKLPLGLALSQISVLKNLYDQAIKKGIDCEFVLIGTPYLQVIMEDVKTIFPNLKFKFLPISLNTLKCSDLILTDGYLTKYNEKDIHDLFSENMCFSLSDDFSVDSTLTSDVIISNKAKSIYSSFENKRQTLIFNKESLDERRSMPKEIAEEFINKLLETKKFNIVSFDKKNILNIENENYKQLTMYAMEQNEIMSFLSKSNGLITVDLEWVHLMSRLGLPSYTLSTQKASELSQDYYKKNDLHILNKESVMNDQELVNIDDVWSNIHIDEIVKQITKKFKKGLF